MSTSYRAMLRLLPLLCLFLVIGCSRFDEDRPVEIDLDADWLPYRVVTARTANGQLMNWNCSRSSEVVDLDGDGVDELALVSHPYARVVWHVENPNATTLQFTFRPNSWKTIPAAGWTGPGISMTTASRR